MSETDFIVHLWRDAKRASARGSKEPTVGLGRRCQIAIPVRIARLWRDAKACRPKERPENVSDVNTILTCAETIRRDARRASARGSRGLAPLRVWG